MNNIDLFSKMEANLLKEHEKSAKQTWENKRQMQNFREKNIKSLRKLYF